MYDDRRDRLGVTVSISRSSSRESLTYEHVSSDMDARGERAGETGAERVKDICDGETYPAVRL
jgi:hypothetical protein